MERDGRACIRWRGRNLYPSIRRSEFRYGQCDNRFGDFGGCARRSCSHCCNRRWRFDSGLGSAVKALKPKVKVWGAEPETAAPGALSFAKQSPQAFTGGKQSFVDGAGGKNIFPRMWERMRPVADGSIVVSLEETRQAMRLLAEKSRVIAEGAGALSVAAALSGKAGKGPIVAVVSGGNVDLDKFYELISQD